MVWTIIVILFVLWLLGLIGNIGGGLIHLLLVAAVVVLIYKLVTRGRAVWRWRIKTAALCVAVF